MLTLLSANLHPYGVRKHIRHEKARIRREFLDEEERKHQIEKVYLKFKKQDTKISEADHPKELKQEKQILKEKLVLRKKAVTKSVSKTKNKITKKSA